VTAVPPTPNCTEFNFTSAESKNGAWVVGWAMGGGIDMLLTQNIFVRAEVEYVAFTKLQSCRTSRRG
jgi:opacity protein-like surface antigen